MARKKKETVVAAAVKPTTYVAIILDKSGSMAKTKATAMSGFNEQVQQLKEDSKTQDIKVCLVTFNGEVFEHLWLVSADQLVEATETDYVPIGGTAMRDAIGFTVQKLLDTTEHENPNNAYLIVTISDGETLNDRHYSVPQLRELVQGCEGTKKWTFTYMGCGAEYLNELARQTGTSVGNMAAWSNDSESMAGNGFKNMRTRQKKFFAERLVGQTQAANYASDDLCVADYTKDAPLEAAPAPVLSDLSTAAKFDWPELSNKLPRYEHQESPVYAGGSLFANSQQVRWGTPDDGADVQASINMAVNMAANTNRPRVRSRK